MVENIIKQMTLKEKVGQLNQHLYGWQCYQKVGDHYELTDLFKKHVKTGHAVCILRNCEKT